MILNSRRLPQPMPAPVEQTACVPSAISLRSLIQWMPQLPSSLPAKFPMESLLLRMNLRRWKFSKTKSRANMPLCKLILPMNHHPLKHAKYLVLPSNSIIMIVLSRCPILQTLSLLKKIYLMPLCVTSLLRGSLSSTPNPILFVSSRMDKLLALARGNSRASTAYVSQAKKRISGGCVSIPQF